MAFQITGTTLKKYTPEPEETKIIVPNGIEVIGRHAFSRAKNIVSVVLPESVRIIEEGAFDCCDNLVSVNVPYGIKVIADSTFMNCDSLDNIFLPDTVTEIEGFAFSGCKSLDSFHISENVTEIGRYSFECAPWKRRQGKNFPIVGDGVLFACPKNLKNLIIPYGVKHVPAILVDAIQQTEFIQIPETVVSISKYFLQSHHLREFSVAENNPHYCSIDGVLYSKDKKTLFFYPPNQTETVFQIPDTVDTIKERAFLYANRLKTIIIPESVKKFSNYTFCEGVQLQFRGQWDGFTLPILDSWKFTRVEQFLNRMQSPSFETFMNIRNKYCQLYFALYLYQKSKDERYPQIIFDSIDYTVKFLVAPEQINLLAQFLECEFFGTEQIDFLLEKAIANKNENTETVLLLLEYKNQHSGYIAPEEHFKL